MAKISGRSSLGHAYRQLAGASDFVFFLYQPVAQKLEVGWPPKVREDFPSTAKVHDLK